MLFYKFPRHHGNLDRVGSCSQAQHKRGTGRQLPKKSVEAQWPPTFRSNISILIVSSSKRKSRTDNRNAVAAL